MATLTLSSIAPDHDAIKTQLEAYLATTDAWRGRFDGSVGQTLIEMIAAVGTYDQAKIRRARQDSIPETAVSDRGIYALASFQGVRLTRKSPASGEVTLTSLVSVTIPAFTQFESSGFKFFNRSAVVLIALVPQTVQLYEGEVTVKNVAGLGEDYQLFFSTETGFSVSDEDVQVVFSNLLVKRVTSGLWNLRFTPGFVDRTLPDGRLALQFGTLSFGSRPDANDTTIITYVTTTGSLSNSYEVITKAVASSDYPGVSGSFTTNLSGGIDEKPASAYKNIGAPSFGTFGSSVTGTQYQTAARDYPGIVDALVFSQRDVNPTALEWMNLMKVVAVTSTPFSALQKEAYIQNLQDKTMYSTRFFWEDPVPEPITVDLTLYCYNWANASQVRVNVVDAITNMFLVKAGSLGYDYYLSDIARVAKEADPGLEYFEINQPTGDIIISSLPVGAPTLVVSAGTGSLAIGVYTYAIAAQTPSGIVTTKNYSSVTVPSASSEVTVSWDPIPGATTYYVYGRDPAAPGLLSTQVGTTFVDTGLTAPGASPPPQNSVPIKYVTLASIAVDSRYSSRQVR